MPTMIEGHVYDFGAECLTCDEVALFENKTERREWLDTKHEGHKVYLYLQARV